VVESIGWGCLLLGVVLSLLSLPGPLVALPGLLLWGYYGVFFVHPYELIVMGVLLLGAEGLEQAGGLLGLSLSGIHRAGRRGLLLGSLLGLAVAVVTLNPLALPLGMVLGALAGEYYEQRSWTGALRTAAGFLLGKAGGYLAKNALVLLVVLYAVWARFGIAGG